MQLESCPCNLTPDWRERFASADVMKGVHVVKRGRLVAERSKVSATIWLDEDVINHFRAAGPGWQPRVNAALRKVIGLKI